jgi:hypothetical protein
MLYTLAGPLVLRLQVGATPARSPSCIEHGRGKIVACMHFVKPWATGMRTLTINFRPVSIKLEPQARGRVRQADLGRKR